MLSRFVPGREDRTRDVLESLRVRARVEKLGPKKFVLHFAASRFAGDVAPAGQTPGEWRFVGRDDALLARLRARFDRNVEKRYRPAEGG